MLLKRFACAIFALLLTGYAHAKAAEPCSTPSVVTPPLHGGRPAEVDAPRIKIFVTNDVHGYVFEDESRKRIGYALLDGYIRAVQQQGCRTFLMDAGDAFSGNTLAQFDAGKGVAELMGRMGYRVIAPGNHAFDYNAVTGNMRYYPDVLLQKLSDFSTGPFEATSINVASVYGDLPHLTQDPVLVADEDGFRLVVLGVLTPYAQSASAPENMQGFYEFGLVVGEDGQPDHLATKTRLLEQIACALQPFDRPGDVVIILSHIGNDDTEEYARGQIRGIDIASIPNVDFIVDAHSHNCIPPRKTDGAWYGNSGRYLERFVEISLVREGDRVTGTMELIDYDQIRVTAVPSEEMLGRLRELSDRMGLGDELFQVRETYLGDEDIHRQSTPLGRFLCGSLKDITGADLTIFNSGSIRSGLAPGWITLGTLYDLIPFQNNIVTFTMTGAEIADFFRSMPLRKTNPFPQFYGVTVYAWDQGDGLPLGIAGIRDGSGQELALDRKYSIAINSFMAQGGDGYSFSLRDKRDHGDHMALFAQHLKSIGQPDFEKYRENRTLIIVPTREAAETAFRKGE